VEETLWFSAEWRLPRSVTLRQKQALLENTLRMLDLTHIRKQRIGDVQSRGISGGEKKRVSIGMELIAEPSVLVMDGKSANIF
jgi:ABC-type multidrug transport system ATPase subunit